ncbi:MAG: flavin reductase [Clostridiales bacterium]|jgi:flavin reductase (DIM6/NTAB) family NADH-FMN oxidoreductase RutF|nr:flavin reductase [Clostridiales bacterium]
MDITAMFKIGYGLYVLTAKEGERHNGCIINTTVQVTDNPNRISICVSKSNFTHGMIWHTGEFNISVLTTSAPYQLFKDFGFRSGKDEDKFAGRTDTAYSQNGLIYLTEHTNAYLSCKVVSALDLGTHTLFIADVTDGKNLSGEESVTYSYYHSNIKPKPDKTQAKKGWRCKVCGYIYEGEELPPDYICPICKHGADAFEKL